MVRGIDLCAVDQQKALAAYVHRYTKDHRPTWAQHDVWKDGKPYPVQCASDRDWLENTRFLVRSNGRLDHRARFCSSSPTWPDNPELRS